MKQTRDLMKGQVAPPAPLYRSEYTAEPQAGSVLDYFGLLWRRKLTVLGAALGGLVLAVGITLPEKPVYRAHTSLEIQDLNSEAMSTKLLNPTAESTSPADALTDLQTQIKILQSRTLIERALDKIQPETQGTPAQTQGGVKSWLTSLPLDRPAANREALVDKVTKNLKVNAAAQTRIVELTYDSTDPKLAARFVNALTSEFIEQNMQAHWQMSRRTSEWLSGQLDEQKSKLQRSEDALQTYARQQGLIYTGDKQNISEEKLRQLQAELSRAQADRVNKQSHFEIGRTTNPDTLPDVLNDGNLRALETNLTDLRRQEAELAVTFQPDYTKTKRIRAEIAALETAVAEKRQAIVSRINNEYEEAQRRERLLSSAYSTQTKIVTGDSEKSIQYDMLKREVDTNRQIYGAMLQRIKEAGIASAMKASNVRIIDLAKTPMAPYKPNLPMNCAVGLLGGALCSLIVIILRARTDSSVREPGDAGLLLGIPELGVIPRAEGNQKVSTSVLGLFPKPGEGGNAELQRLAWHSQSPVVADSFRTVLASILFAGVRDHQRVLVVTSAAPGEGKTTTSTNLAVTLANMKRRVLLIDADIRNPRIHELFGLDNSLGVTNLLRETAPAKTLMDVCIQKTAVKNLSVLTSGPAVQAGADLLFSRSMPELIARYKEQFDMVIIDTPPMLSMPDARMLGRMADAVVLIARAGKTSRVAIQAAYRRLVEDHTNVLGIVLNDWNAKQSAQNYYAGYTARVAEPFIETTSIEEDPAELSGPFSTDSRLATANSFHSKRS